MTTFRLFPTSPGYACLLESGRGRYLVDSGGVDDDLPAILRARGVRRLRAAVVSRGSMDRLGGALRLMESGFDVREYWLPAELEILAESARRFDGDWRGWTQAMDVPESDADDTPSTGWDGVCEVLPLDSRRRRLECAAMCLALGMTVCLGWAPYAGVKRDATLGGPNESGDGLARFFAWTLELLAERGAQRWRAAREPMARIMRSFGCRFFRGGDPADMAYLCARLLLDEASSIPDNEKRRRGAAVQTLAAAAAVSALLTRADAALRYFRLEDVPAAELVPRHPLRCLNGTECAPLAEVPPSVGWEALLAAGDAALSERDGLAFQYGDPRCSVLLCGDAAFGFATANRPFTLDRPTVAVAPRHGGPGADAAYIHVRSADPRRDVWVGGVGSSRKLSPLFMGKGRTLCLRHCDTLALQEITLRFEGGQWNRETGSGCSHSLELP